MIAQQLTDILIILSAGGFLIALALISKKGDSNA